MPETIREKLADWIDTDVIADHIIDEMKEQGSRITLKYAKNVWLDVLQCELHDAIKNAVTAIRSL
jgi:hypothetical protein